MNFINDLGMQKVIFVNFTFIIIRDYCIEFELDFNLISESEEDIELEMKASMNISPEIELQEIKQLKT